MATVTKKKSRQLTVYEYDSFYTLIKTIQTFLPVKKMAKSAIDNYKKQPDNYLLNIQKRLLSRYPIICSKEVLIPDVKPSSGIKKPKRLNLIISSDFIEDWDNLIFDIRDIEKIGILTEQYIANRIFNYEFDKVIKSDAELKHILIEIFELQKYMLGIPAFTKKEI